MVTIALDRPSLASEDAMIGEIDMDGNGAIDFAEFCNSMARRMQCLGAEP